MALEKIWQCCVIALQQEGPGSKSTGLGPSVWGLDFACTPCSSHNANTVG